MPFFNLPVRIGLAAVIAAGTWLASMGVSGPSAHADTVPGTLRVINNVEPRGLVSMFAGGTSVAEVSAKLHDSLLFAENGAYEPRLAESWSVNDEATRFTFKLRSGVKWHDGRPFTVGDVVFTARNVWTKIVANPAFEAIESIEATDDETVVITTAHPVSPDLMLTSLGSHYGPVLPKHIYEGTDYRKNPNNRAAVGTGPFKFSEWKSGQYLVLVRNHDYYRDGLPRLDKIIFRFARDESTKAAALESGEVDMGVRNPLPLRDVERIRKMEGLEVVAEGSEGAQWFVILEMNTRKEITGNANVRRAIAHAIDRQAIANIVFLKHGKPATSPIGSGSRFFAGDTTTYDFDPQKAEQMLDEAGYPRKSDGVRFTLDYVVASWFSTTRQTGELIRQQLQDVGIGINLITPDIAGVIKRVYTDYDFDLSVSNMVAFQEPGLASFYWYWTKGILPGVAFRNATGYSNPDMDAVIDAAITETDRDRRARLIQDFQRIAMRDVPILPLAEMDQLIVKRSAVKNVPDNTRWYYTDWARAFVE